MSFKKCTIDESGVRHLTIERSSKLSGPIEQKLFTHYTRFAFVMLHLHAALGCDIKVEGFSWGFVRRLRFEFLEIKTIQDAVPLIHNLIAPYNLTPVSFSKYLTAVEELSLV